MAILQISKIQVRQGLQSDLPQLAGGEFGWSNDSRRLFIGNGTIDEGAPVLGNTEVLTEYSYQQMSGQYVRLAGVSATLSDNTTSLTVVTDTNGVPFTLNAASTPAFTVNYTLTRGLATRSGVITVATNTAGLLNSQDNNIENTSTGVTLSVVQSGAAVSLKYTTTSTGESATLQYAISYFN